MTETRTAIVFPEVTDKRYCKVNRDFQVGQLVFFLDAVKIEAYWAEIQQRRSKWLLARQKCRAASQIRRSPETSLFEYLRARLHYQQELVEKHLTLVNGILHGLRWPYGIAYEDLVAEGHLALVMAARCFNSGYNVQFSSYAYRCIRNAVIKRIDKDARYIRACIVSDGSEYSEVKTSSLEQLPDITSEFNFQLILFLDLKNALEYIEKTYQKRPGVISGFTAICLNSKGFKYCEIARHWGMTKNYLNALVSRTKSVLRKDAIPNKILLL